jgi:hypothetical protein
MFFWESHRWLRVPGWIGWMGRGGEPYCSCLHSASCNMCEADSWLPQGMVQGLRHFQTHPRVLNTKLEGQKLEKFS